MPNCPKCGFDLKGNESECPRCGVITAKVRPRTSSLSVADVQPLPTAVPSRPYSTPAMKPRSRVADILRWILCFPVGIFAGFVTMVVGVALFGPHEASYAQTSAPAISAMNMGLATAVALLVVWAISPSRKPWGVMGLAGLLIVLNLLEIKSATRTLQMPRDRIRIAEALGFIAVSALFLLIAISKARRRSHMESQT